MDLSDWRLELDYRAALPAMARLPRRWAYALADRRAAWLMARRPESREASLRNLSTVFPEKSPRELEEIVARQFRVQSRDQLESYWYRRPWSFFEPFVEISGLETLREAIARGRGVMLFSGHIGCTGLFFVAMGLNGVRLNIIGLPLDSGQIQFPAPFLAYAQNRVAGIERAIGAPFILTGRGNYPLMLEKLQAGEVLMILIDVIPGLVKRRVEVDFLGRPCWFGDGAVQLCRSTGARLLEWNIHQDLKSDRHRIEIRDPGVGDLASQSNQQAMAKLAAILDRRIRRHPEDWGQWDSLTLFERSSE